MPMKEYPFGSCQYENTYKWAEFFISKKAEWPPMERVKTITQENVLAMCEQCSNDGWDAWSAYPVISPLVVTNGMDMDDWADKQRPPELSEVDGPLLNEEIVRSESKSTGLSVAILCVMYGIELDEMANMDWST